jgi:Uma2 family endonuclease
MATHPTWRFRVTDLEPLRLSGVLPEDVRVELLDGEVAPMSPSGSEHGSVTNRLHDLLTKTVGDRAMVWGQSSVILAPHTLVLPDVALVRPRPDHYFGAPPSPDDLLLVVEVSHSSLARDREVKVPLYARAGVPELWIVHVEARRIEVLREPKGDRFQARDLVGLGGRLSIAAMDGVTLAVRDFLPEA